ncbi:NAD(P)-dependent dehydrogenase (short-subunit alcohol dehydrogenase family) [Paraburkholderia sp. GAS41]|jgi:NAD(P)-dependent dehydrogenase (short-subunit alcohol dehydrogenase family)|uniref:SDR family oxidoreductase n=1 Tax=Paraburkholderia sp. GAS41 TaxID=3035134 RepID=UPI003D1D1E5B
MSKTILITGTSNGFGNDIAVTLAAAGHRVFATMRDVHGRHREAAQALNSRGIETLELDVTDDASVDAAFKALFAKTGGKLDVLINNAGIAAGGIQETFTPEQTRAMFDVNVFGIQRVTRAALPSMHKARSGLIVNIGSILGRVTLPFFALYGATKHAVEAVTEGYRYELSQQGIDVVLLQPGPYPTKLYTAIQKPADIGRAESYGDLVKLQAGFEEFLGGLFSSEGAPDPHDVATTLVDLIAQPSGQRPNRVTVGLDFGANAANAAIEPIQSKLVADIGMEHLNALKSA